jgi:hypothetical protein
MGAHRTTHRIGRALASAVLATAVACTTAVAIGAPPASAGEIAVAVTTTADTVANDGVTSLREAFTIANTDLNQNTIILGAGQTYVLDRCQGGSDEEANVGGDLDHTAPETLTILGNGATIRQTCTVERVIDKGTGTFIVGAVTIEDGAGGTAGGGISAAGNLFLDHVILRGNAAITGGGGGAWSGGDLAVDDSTITENSSSSNGGGLRAVGDLRVFTSLVSRNISGAHGGGLWAPELVQIRNSTVSQNVAVYGGAVESAEIQAQHATIVANRATFGANVAGGELNPVASVIALGSQGEDCDLDGGTPISSNNIGDDESCELTGTNDVEEVHPQLGPIASSGGPTQTQRPMVGSPALDHDPPACLLPSDQRGQARPVGSGCDAGAFEGNPPACGQVFTDVGVGHPFHSEVCWLTGMGITGGYADGGFHPSAAVSRQAMAAFLHRLAGAPLRYAPEVAEFDDVPTTHPFAIEISWLVEEQISTGYADGGFHPLDAVSRQAMAAFLHRMAGTPLIAQPAQPTFSDVPFAHPFFTQVEWLAGQGVTEGYADGTFQPGAAVSRQAMAAFLQRTAEEVELSGI